MSKPRFTIEFRRLGSTSGGGCAEGWCVLDRGRRITILFADYAEAERHRDNIRRLYLRFGW